MRQNFLKFLGCLAMICGASFAHAQHAGDVDVTVVSGKIVTNARVYGVELGETFDYFSDEPGYDALPGTFNGVVSVGFDILGSLKVWNGTDFNTTAIPRLLFAKGPASVLTPTSNTFLTGLAVNSNIAGEWHHHFNMTLVNSSGGPLTAAPPLAEVGVYLIELQLRTAQPGIESSLPYSFVINNGDSELNHDAAIAYQVAAIPEPGTWALLGCCLAGSFGIGRHLRRRVVAPTLA